MTQCCHDVSAACLWRCLVGFCPVTAVSSSARHSSRPWLAPLQGDPEAARTASPMVGPTWCVEAASMAACLGGRAAASSGPAPSTAYVCAVKVSGAGPAAGKLRARSKRAQWHAVRAKYKHRAGRQECWPCTRHCHRCEPQSPMVGAVGHTHTAFNGASPFLNQIRSWTARWKALIQAFPMGNTAQPFKHGQQVAVVMATHPIQP